MHTPILEGHCFQNTESDSREDQTPWTSGWFGATDSAKMVNKWDNSSV